ncbi:hypothetical protein PR002_g32556 [Phytophthora rubi]|uniref:Uncharacterized protein n=1 Tax=Phytophthora rubi TaxID=129364 RepID=A0A6A3G2Y9_9STRA|nr:hypothetical protein PR002_g32556 [Phytophthora rubi]
MPVSPSSAVTDTSTGVTVLPSSCLLRTMRTIATRAPPAVLHVRNGITTFRPVRLYRTSLLLKSLVAPWLLMKSTPIRNSSVHPSTMHASMEITSSNTVVISNLHTPTTSSRKSPIPST